jgi:hypothetical protein
VNFDVTEAPTQCSEILARGKGVRAIITLKKLWACEYFAFGMLTVMRMSKDLKLGV